MIKTNLQTIADFLKLYPEYKGIIKVDGRYGLHPIDDACITAYNEQIYEIKIGSIVIKGSANHNLYTKFGWKSLVEINPNDEVLTKYGYQIVEYVKQTSKYMDLYDLQVRSVKEFYANGVVSHNSTICESVMFALFGSVIKDVKKEEIVNDVTRKNCEVYLQFTVNDNGNTVYYEIERGISPSFCNLFVIENGERVDISLSVPKTNEKIEGLLGINKYIFTQTLIMSIGKSKPFFSYTAPERRKYIEGIFNIDIFSKMSKTVSQQSKILIDKRISANAKYEQLSNTLQSYIFKRDNFIKERDEIIEKLTENITKYQNTIDELTPTIPELIVDDLDSELIVINSKIDTSNASLNKVQGLLNAKIGQLSSLQTTLNGLNFSDNCGMCGQPLPESFRLEYETKVKIYENDILKIKSDIEGIKKIKDKCEATIKSLDNDRTIIYNRKIERSNIASRRSQIINNIHIYTDNIKDSKRLIEEHLNRSNDFDDLITNANIDIKTVNDEISCITKEIKSLEICKMLLSDEGVKVNIIQKFRSFLNKTVNKYLSKMNAPAKCTFDEYFDCLLYNVNGREKSYDLFSSGEQKRIDLAMLFTFQDILRIQNGINIHLSFYDEILDTSLCDSGRDAVLNIIKERSEYSSEYIISHKQKSLSIIDREIKLEKRCGFTHLKEIVNAN